MTSVPGNAWEYAFPNDNLTLRVRRQATTPGAREPLPRNSGSAAIQRLAQSIGFCRMRKQQKWAVYGSSTSQGRTTSTRRKGDPILFDTCWHKPISEIQHVEGKDVIGWQKPAMSKSNIVYHYDGWLERQSDLLPGIYYSLSGVQQNSC